MKASVLFVVLLKATFLSFSGFGSLPVLREELVTNRGVLTDDELNESVAVARMTPGPMGSYVIAVGYAVAGWPGATAGWAAMSLPALGVLPLMMLLRGRAHSERWRSAIEAVILASAALVLVTATALIPVAVTDTTTAVVAAVALLLVLFTRVPTICVVCGGAAATFLTAMVSGT